MNKEDLQTNNAVLDNDTSNSEFSGFEKEDYKKLYDKIKEEEEANTEQEETNTEEEVSLEQEEETEEKKAEDEAEKKTEQLKPYTQEELDKIIKDGKDINPNRLPQALLNIYKKMQSDYTKKTQTLAEERKKLEEEKIQLQKQQNQPTDPKQLVFQAYLQDPVAVTKTIEAETDKLFEQLEDAEVGSDEYKQIQRNIRSLDKLKSELSLEKERLIAQQSLVNRTIIETQNELRKEIPDFDNRAKKLVEFAQETLGLSQQDVLVLSDPNIVGQERAVKVIKAINNLYNEVSASESAEKKNKKPNPPELQRKTSTTSISGKNIENMDDKEFSRWYSKQISKNW